MVLTLAITLVAVYLLFEFYLFPIERRFAKQLFTLPILQSAAWLVVFILFSIPLIPSLIATVVLAALFVIANMWSLKNKENLRILFVKQGAVGVVLGFAAYVIAPPTEKHIAVNALVSADWWKLFCWTIAFLLAMKPSSLAISLLLKNWTDELFRSESTPQQKPLKDAGAFIGYFERALIVIFVIWGQLPGVALVLAAKSVFRFGDLKDHGSRMYTEYVLLGTFASVLFGIGSGLIGMSMSRL
ncbi:DUF3307 domain-containing protein [Enterovibrio nigricans]|uniref:Uncharacterized protein n=1 Tax=Enterovibrio nigricans DSM 22720 TaxID=1121868 RepID=A0A1T4VVX3_9GAMM|nr:DUF3307 domain-containing protein [Enterovibrio nigricans]PKF49315.1 DUF3307 domain-containing protein [Enterovibrio nigricans]SKA68965.1 hypothetical protein SAMN02745132_04377 [Enterovibrio nigricans DSM 22720]